jgi:hypothetical protein
MSLSSDVGNDCGCGIVRHHGGRGCRGLGHRGLGGGVWEC